MNSLPCMRVAWTLAVLGAALLAAGYLLGYRVNTTRSAPLGLWRITTTDTENLKVGDWVIVCPPTHPAIHRLVAAGILPAGHCPTGVVPFLKPVAALAGDHFAVSEAGVSINGTLIAGTAPVHYEGLPWADPTQIPANHFVGLQTMHPGSIDARYFGPLPIRQIIGLVKPVWVFRTGS